jgi:hypothetical protein
MDRVVQNVFAQQGFKRLAIDYVTGSIKDFVHIESEPGILKNSKGATLIEFNQYIDIAIGPRLSPRHGAEDGNMRHA